MLLAAFQAPIAMAQSTTSASPSEPVLLAAGSLRAAMGELLAAYRASGGAQFNTVYGPSGKLRKDIESGRAVDVFASASTEHTAALARQGLLGEPAVFTHNALCVVSRPELKLRPENLLDELGKPTLRLASSTPGSDPMGDYTWQFFRNADQRQPGLYAILDAKALKLSGTAELAPDSTLPYVTAFEQDKADAYVMYCTNAVLTKQAVPRLEILRIPDALNVRSSYGIAARSGSAEGERLLGFVLGPAGQAILRQHGFH